MVQIASENVEKTRAVKLIVLDRDGTINHDSDQFIKSPDEWRPIPGSLEAIARLNHAGYRVVVATNQSGIGRGLFDMTTLNAIHDKMHRALSQVGGRLDAIFYCPHTADATCDCRKPKPGLLVRAAAELRLDLRACTMVGDKASDLVPARTVGARGVLVLTGYGRGEWEHRREHFSVSPDFVAADLLDAVEWALTRRPA